jgi:tetratricopeptide (TPR) repeat protein
MARFDPFWHERQAEAGETAGEWSAAAFHWGQLAEHQPWEARNWKKLDSVCIRLGDWRPVRVACDRLLRRDSTLAPIYLRRGVLCLRDRDPLRGCADLLRWTLYSAAEDHQLDEFAGAGWQATEPTPGNGTRPDATRPDELGGAGQLSRLWHLLHLARADLAADDEPGFRATCGEIQAYLGDLEINQSEQDAARRAAIIARTACLIRTGGNDPDTLVGLAARAVGFNPASAAYRETYGAALYRAGRYKQAAEELQKALRLTGQGGSPWQHLFLAMAYHRLGQAHTFRAHLDKAKLDEQASWTGRLIHQRLQQEAEELGKAVPKPGR